MFDASVFRDITPISDFHLMEIDQQIERQVKQFHVAQKLRLVNGGDATRAAERGRSNRTCQFLRPGFALRFGKGIDLRRRDHALFAVQQTSMVNS